MKTTDLREAAQQALEALEKYRQMMFAEAGCRWDAGDSAITTLRAALAQEQAEPTGKEGLQVELVQEPVAWMFTDREGTEFFEQREDWDGWWTPLYTTPPRCPNCASLEAQNTELDRKLAQLEQEPQTLDDALRLTRARAQAYENGYRAGIVHERERIIQFLQEMQRVVGDAHNHYGVAAMRIRERV